MTWWEDDRCGDDFQEKSKSTRAKMKALEDYTKELQATKKREEIMKETIDQWIETKKIYKNVEVVQLPEPDFPESHSYYSLLLRRQSLRAYSNEPLTLQEISYLLWASTGVQRIERRFGMPFGFRTAPSAGGIYPTETYLAVKNVTGLDPGIYHYNVEKHHLEFIKKGDFHEQLKSACQNQNWVLHAPVIFLWTAIFRRTTVNYTQRGYRYVYLDTAHIGAQCAFAALDLKMGSVPIAAFYDDEINAILGADGKKESILYLTLVGRPKNWKKYEDRMLKCHDRVEEWRNNPNFQL